MIFEKRKFKKKEGDTIFVGANIRKSLYETLLLISILEGTTITDVIEGFILSKIPPIEDLCGTIRQKIDTVVTEKLQVMGTADCTAENIRSVVLSEVKEELRTKNVPEEIINLI